jgi:SAM-dependent methyltransferase
MSTSLRGASAPNRYGRLCAEIYDLDKPVGSLRDLPFHLSRLRDVDGPVLAGLEVDGFDPSPEMLERCGARCAERGLAPRLWRADFSDFGCRRPYAAVVIAVGSFLFAGEFEAGLASLRRAHVALQPGGRLLIDLPPLSFLTDSMDAVRSWTAANGDLLRLISQDVAVDWIAQTRTCHDRYERWRDGRLVETELEVMRYRAWSQAELTYALAEAGFVDVVVRGNYQDRPPRPGDRVLSWQARRAG